MYEDKLDILYAITRGDAEAYLDMRDDTPEDFDEAAFVEAARKVLNSIDSLSEYMSLAFDEAYRVVTEGED